MSRSNHIIHEEKEAMLVWVLSFCIEENKDLAVDQGKCAF